MVKRILFIDDDPAFVEPFIEALRIADYDVEHQGDFLSGFKAAQRYIFDLIILDLILPMGRGNGGQVEWKDRGPEEEVGLRLHAAIRNDPNLNNVPIIFLTVINEQDIRKHIRHREKRYFRTCSILVKPTLPSTLLREVKYVLGGSHVRR
jgi:DNA-binding response OmpR family regulator